MERRQRSLVPHYGLITSVELLGRVPGHLLGRKLELRRKLGLGLGFGTGIGWAVE